MTRNHRIRPLAGGTLFTALIWTLVTGCASAPISPPPVDGVAAPLGAPGLPNEQRLFRAQVEGQAGEGSLRLVLRVVSTGDYELEANDPFGRSLWTLRFEGGSGDVVDHRQKTYCRYGASVPLPEASLEDLPLASIASVLLGREPIAPAGPVEELEGGAVEFRNGADRWRLRRSDEGELVAWTFFGSGARPVLWWSRDARGHAVLSHREGAQLRWSESVREPLVGGLPPWSPPEGYSGCTP